MCAECFAVQHPAHRSKSTQPTFTGEHLKCQCWCSAGVSVSLESPGNTGGMRADKVGTVVLSSYCTRGNCGKVQIMSMIINISIVTYLIIVSYCIMKHAYESEKGLLRTRSDP